MIYLTLEELLYVAKRAIAGEVKVRDYGLLEAAVARPQASVFGADAYPDLFEKAAALMQSLARNHALVDGNKRLALAGLLAFLGMNGYRLVLSEDEAFELTVRVAVGSVEVFAIAQAVRAGSEPRPTAQPGQAPS